MTLLRMLLAIRTPMVRCCLAAMLAVSLSVPSGFAQPTQGEQRRFEEALAAYDAGDYERSFALFQQLAEKWTGAQYYLALHHLTGAGTLKDEVTGVILLHSAAEGFPKAGRMLAGAYMVGLWGLARDRTSARQLLDLAVAEGDSDAQGMLSVLDMSSSRLTATRDEVDEYISSIPPRHEKEYDGFEECMQQLGNWALRASQHVFIMVPLKEAKDWFVGALMGPEPTYAKTGESIWECRGGRLRLWS